MTLRKFDILIYTEMSMIHYPTPSLASFYYETTYYHCGSTESERLLY